MIATLCFFSIIISARSMLQRGITSITTRVAFSYRFRETFLPMERKLFKRFKCSKVDSIINEDFKSSHNISKIHSFQLQKESTFCYNSTTYPFADSIRHLLMEEISTWELGIPTTVLREQLKNLSELHHFPDTVGQIVKDKNMISISRFQYIWNVERSRGANMRIKSTNKQLAGRDFHYNTGDRIQTNISEKYKAFDMLYRKFIQEEVGPKLGGGLIIFQRAPSLRVYLPDSSITKLHCDRDYHHQPTELNFWLPITTAGFNNSLWTESEPMKGDFHPLNLQYGQYNRFFGNLCRHMTYPNDTNTTRISLDFRAVSASSGGHDPSFRKGVRRGGKAQFQNSFDLGGFYDSIEC